jgi:ABC-type polysaccharide/polyol phosphate transport system ATPase subunit
MVDRRRHHVSDLGSFLLHYGTSHQGSGISEMSDFPLLQVKGASKLYARRTRDTRRKLGSAAWRAFFNVRTSKPVEPVGTGFWAVKDVSFELYRGSALGIIGLNGSGKTTMLRMLAGQLLPDAGEISIDGTSAAMIDLQAGFQASASGRENIFLRAAALGFRRAETVARLNEIVAFSELGEAIDAPLATYSSGMRLRLAFAVMTTVSPDLLLIDEVLAVGDFRFRQKCLAKVREMRDRSAFVFVSHSMGDVSRFCDHVIVLHKGMIYFEGPPKEAIEVYETLESGTVGVSQVKGLSKAMGPILADREIITDVTHEWCDSYGRPVNKVSFSDQIELKIGFRSTIDIRNLIIGVPIWAVNTHYTTGLSTQITSDSFRVKAGEEVRISVIVEGGFLNPGEIKSMLGIMDGPEFLYRNTNPDLTVAWAPFPTWGAVTVPHKWMRSDKQERSAPIARLMEGKQ